MANDIFFEINGVKFTGLIKASLTQTLENFVDIFSFTFSVEDKIVNQRRIPQNLIKVQDEIRIFIDNNLRSTGYVDKLSIGFNDDSHILSIEGRSKTSDIVDSSIIGAGYNEFTDYEALVRSVLNNNGYSDIKIINNLGVLPIKLKSDSSGWGNDSESETEKSNTDKKIFGFLDKYALEAKVLLRTNENGDITLIREEREQVIGNLISTKNNENNNIKAANIVVDGSKRFRFNEIYTEEDNSFFTANAVSPENKFEDSLVRSPRRIRSQKKFTSNTEDLDGIVKWETNLRRAQSINYSCVVQGFYNDKKSTNLWQPNKLVKVSDDKCQLDGQFLIKGVTYNKDLDNGTLTKLDIVNRGTFNLDPDQVTKNLVSNDFGNGLINVDV